MEIGISSKRVSVRLLSSDDLPAYICMFSQTVRQCLHATSACHELDYVRSCLQQSKTMFYGVFYNDTQKLIGAVAIRDATRCPGQLYCWINECYWGKGLFQEALSLVADTYFISTQERFFSARVDIDNMRSYRALKKCGFADIGFTDGPHGKQYELVLRRR